MKLGKKPAPEPRRRPQAPRDTSPAAYTYRARRSDQLLNVGRQINREALKPAVRKASRFWLARFGLLALLIAVAISLISALSLSTHAKIMPLNTGSGQGAYLRPLATYQAAADKLLGSSLWNHNKITVDTGKIGREMVKQFPELANVSVAVPLVSHRPIIYLEPARPSLVMVARNGSYVIDASGKALSSASDLNAAKQKSLPVVTDQTGFKVTVSQQALPAADVSFIQTVIGQLSAKGYQVSTMTLPAAASELDVHLANQPYYVKFNLQNNDARQQAGTFMATIAELKKQNITPGEYVDVRVDTHAYYK